VYVHANLPTIASSCCPVMLGFLSSWCSFPLGFGFFKDADSNVAPSSYSGTAIGAGDKAVSGRIVWNDEFIAATLRASESGIRHGACRPFWSALANLVPLGPHDYAPEWTEVKPCAEAARSLAFASTLAEMPRWARQLAGPRRYAMKTGTRGHWDPFTQVGKTKLKGGTLKLATVAEIQYRHKSAQSCLMVSFVSRLSFVNSVTCTF
jgi:hypothetical protein